MSKTSPTVGRLNCHSVQVDGRLVGAPRGVLCVAARRKLHRRRKKWGNTFG